MKLLYKNGHEGAYFSKNGWRAFKRGERPKFMFPPNTPLRPTIPHHVETETPKSKRWVRKLVMFYLPNYILCETHKDLPDETIRKP